MRFNGWFSRKCLNNIRRMLSGISPLDGAPSGSSQFSSIGQLLSGKTVLITGAGHNIGKSIVWEMAAQGATIVAVEKDGQRCDGLDQELKMKKIPAWSFCADVSRMEDMEKLGHFLQTNHIHIDILVHNAALQLEDTNIQTFKSTEWCQTFETNLIGPLHLTSILTDRMRHCRTRGSVLFITSIHQWVVARRPAYSASKAALGMVIKELALDLAPFEIRVNGIAPGWVQLDQTEKVLHDRYTPLYQTTIDPCYIGRAAVYLSSDYFSRHTTGSVVQIDGGLALFNHRVCSSWRQEGW